MSVPANFFDTYAIQQSPTDDSETGIAQVLGLTELLRGLPVHLRAWVDIAPEAATTAIVLKLRRGTDTSGTVVGTSTIEGPGTVTGITDTQGIVECVDTPGDFAGQSYILTATCTAAAGAATVNAVHIEARVG